MHIYLVGGAVRDRILGIAPKDEDFVITGAEAVELDQLQGLRRVGKDFPIWVDPNRREYALARRSRLNGNADFGPEVTIEEDLGKRDLTINAIAMDTETNEIIDPYGGQVDIERKLLRMVSADAFTEDPVRILRVCRFAARFPEFSIDPTTRDLMTGMCAMGALKDAQPERVWKELSRGLIEDQPERMLEEMLVCGALEAILPEVFALWGVPQPEKWHPEIDTFTHTKQALRYAADQKYSLVVRYAVMLHDVGKGVTPPEKWPSHPGHEGDGVPLVEAINQRLRVPSAFAELAVLVCRDHGRVHSSLVMKTTSIVKLLRQIDAFRRPARLQYLIDACTADARGRDGRPFGRDSHFTDVPYPQGDRLIRAFEAAQEIDTLAIVSQQKSPEFIPVAIHAARARAIRQAEREYNQLQKVI